MDKFDKGVREEKEDYKAICEALLLSAKADRCNWEEAVRMTFPELLKVADLQKPARNDEEPLCSHARQGVLSLASAHVSYITPMGERWFQYTPIMSEDAGEYDEEDSWFAKATQVTQETVERSNFYNEAYAVYIDRIATGTGALLCEMHRPTQRLIFTHIPAGTYGVAENSLHEVDTLCREWKATPAQLVEQFGEENVSATTRTAYQSDKDRYSKEVRVYQLVEPRRGREVSRNVGETNAQRMPWKNVYLEESGHVLYEGGYTEFPYCVTRFVRYGNSAYGRSALVGVLQDMLDLRKMRSIMMTVAERKAIPSMLVTAEIADEVDFRAGGKTIISALDSRSDVPREFAPASDMRDAMLLIQECQKEIDDAVFRNALQAVSDVDKTMTAREVSARMAEKAMTITQSFTQFSVDFYPMHQRIFACCYRLGLLPREGRPKYVSQPILNRKGKIVGEAVQPPQVKYCGRMAQVLQNAQINALDNTINELVDLYRVTQMPEWLLPLDIKRIVRFKLNGQSFPQQCVRSLDEVENMLERIEKEQMAQAQMQIVQAQASANRDNAEAYAKQTN